MKNWEKNHLNLYPRRCTQLHFTQYNFEIHIQPVPELPPHRHVPTAKETPRWQIVVYLTSSCVNWAFLAWVGPWMPKKAQFTQERVEYKVFLFDEPLKGSKSLKIFKISLTFHFDKLWHLSKSAHTGEMSQILTVSNKKINFPVAHFTEL
jgi:hypothetical protein